MLQVSSNMLKVLFCFLTVATVPPVLSRTSQLKKFQISAARKQKQEQNAFTHENEWPSNSRQELSTFSPLHQVTSASGSETSHSKMAFSLSTASTSSSFFMNSHSGSEHRKSHASFTQKYHGWVGVGGWGWGCMEGRHTQWTPRLCKSISTLLRFLHILCQYRFSMVGSPVASCMYLQNKHQHNYVEAAPFTGVLSFIFSGLHSYLSQYRHWYW